MSGFVRYCLKFAISNSPKIGNSALTFPIACGKLINADEAVCLISLDADIAQLVERLIRNHQVKGSSPFIGSIFYRGVAQFGSAFGSGPKGRRFKSCHLDQKNGRKSSDFRLFLMQFAQRRVFGTFSLQLFCNLSKCTKEPQASICCGFAILTTTYCIFLQVTFWLRDK